MCSKSYLSGEKDYEIFISMDTCFDFEFRVLLLILAWQSLWRLEWLHCRQAPPASHNQTKFSTFIKFSVGESTKVRLGGEAAEYVRKIESQLQVTRNKTAGLILSSQNILVLRHIRHPACIPEGFYTAENGREMWTTSWKFLDAAEAGVCMPPLVVFCNEILGETGWATD